VCAVEWNAYAASVLVARQNDGCLPPFPIWDDVQTFDGRPWRRIVDVISGGFPCQDISCAGKGAGIEGERSGMWFHMARIISEVRPPFVFVENSPMLTSRGLGRVLGDLATLGYDARWGVLGSDTSGGSYIGERIWIVATKAASIRQQVTGRFFNAINPKKNDDRQTDWFKQLLQGITLPYVCRENHEMADGVDRLTAIGNGQDPVLATLAWNILSENPLTAPIK
jgi:DNA (cytosine-5)-methyltransferase 1